MGEYSKVQLGTKVLDGNYHDLSAFGHSLAKWRDIKFKVVHKTATIYIDGKEIYRNSVEGNFGKLNGFVLHSKGTAEFDFVDLKANGKIVMHDDFYN